MTRRGDSNARSLGERPTNSAAAASADRPASASRSALELAKAKQLAAEQRVAERVPSASGMHETRSRPLTLRDSGIDGSLMFARDVDFRVTGDIGFMIHDMAATLTPTHAGLPIVFDDPTSVTINVHRGDVTLDSARLTAIFNRYLFQYQGSPLRNMRVMPQDCSERHPLLGNRPGNPSATANWVVRVRSAASAGAARNHAQ